MRMLKRFFYVAAIASGLTVSAFAQTQTGGQTGQNGGGLGGGGSGLGGGGSQQGQGQGQTTGLPFGAGGSVGVVAEQFSTVSNSATNTNSNVLGGFYANPMYQGRIGATGTSNPGGFGSPLYNSGTSGGMTGAGGNRTGGSSFGGSGGMSGGRTGTTTGFGGGGASTGYGGGSTSTGFGGGTGSGSTGIGGGTTTGFGGGTTGGRSGQQQFGGGSSFGGGGAYGSQSSQNIIPGDRAVGSFYRPSNVNPVTTTPMAARAQDDLRGLFDRSASLSTGKGIAVAVSADGLVHLRGSVATEDEKRLAIGLAQTSPGVRQVVSELTILPKP